ncbi:MAG: GTP cyclohydrolase II [Caldilineaceae bacterium]
MTSSITYPSAQPIQRTVVARIPTAEGEFWLYHYRNQRDDKEHLAIVLGEVAEKDDVLVRVHSECFTGDVLGSRRCDCGEQLHLAMWRIAQQGCGAILYLRQEGRGIGLEEKLKAYNLQDEGYDTVEANLRLGHQADEREYWAAAGILADLRIRSVRLLTNNPDKLEKLAAEGVTIRGRTPVRPSVHADNRFYLETKVQKMRHMLSLPTLSATSLSKLVSNGNGSNGHQHEPEAPSVAATNSNPSAFFDEIEAKLEALQQRIAHHRAASPFVTLSWAQSLDGSIAAEAGKPLRLSAEGSMRLTHRLRSMHDAILVGIGTVLADNPRLTTRLVEGPSPRPIIIDSRLRTPPGAALFAHPQRPIFAVGNASSQAIARIQAEGGEVWQFVEDADGRIPLGLVLGRLAKIGVRSLMVEGGALILNRFLSERLGNYGVITIAPRFVGGIHAVQSNQNVAQLQDCGYSVLDGDLICWGELR